MKGFGQRRASRRADVVAQKTMPLSLAEATGPWFQGFCASLMLLLYREILRLMVWARAMNW